MSLDDLKYKLSDVGTNLKYKLDDVKGNPRARVWIIGGAAALVLVIVFGFYSLPRLLPGSPGGGPAVETKAFKGSDDDWIAKARAAIAADPKYANVTIDKGVDEAGGAIIVIRGPMMDMPDRIVLGSKFQSIGQPENLVYQLGSSEGP